MASNVLDESSRNHYPVCATRRLLTEKTHISIVSFRWNLSPETAAECKEERETTKRSAKEQIWKNNSMLGIGWLESKKWKNESFPWHILSIWPPTLSALSCWRLDTTTAIITSSYSDLKFHPAVSEKVNESVLSFLRLAFLKLVPG